MKECKLAVLGHTVWLIQKSNFENGTEKANSVAITLVVYACIMSYVPNRCSHRAYRCNASKKSSGPQEFNVLATRARCASMFALNS